MKLKLPPKKYIIAAVVVLGAASFAFAVLFGKGLFLKKGPKEPAVTLPAQPEAEINFSILESDILKELEPFERIPAFEGEVGRENPFLPY